MTRRSSTSRAAAIPEITLNELKGGLGDTPGISRFQQRRRVPSSAPAGPTRGVENQPQVDRHEIRDGHGRGRPDTGRQRGQAVRVDREPGHRRAHDARVTTSRIGSMDGNDWQYVPPGHPLGRTHMPTRLLWVHAKLGTTAHDRRAESAAAGWGTSICFGGPNQISGAVGEANSPSTEGSCGSRTTIRSPSTLPPTDSPRGHRDRVREVLLRPGGHVRLEDHRPPGHGFSLVKRQRLAGAVRVGAALRTSASTRRLILTSSANDACPPDLEGYFSSVSPFPFLDFAAADGPYNMTYVIGGWDKRSAGTSRPVSTTFS